MALHITPRIGAKVGPLYVGASIRRTRPASVKTSTPVKAKTRRTRKTPRPPYVSAHYIAAMLAAENAQRAAAQADRVVAKAEPRIAAPAPVAAFPGYGPATLHRASRRAVQRATQPAQQRAQHTPRRAWNPALVALGMVLTAMVGLVALGMLGMALHLTPDTTVQHTPRGSVNSVRTVAYTGGTTPVRS